ncbi:MAG: hypothetical protein M3441_24535 [Chloroflexota bacterium]|nr:hypothetical protein [Chloroflexota bacterium]
MANNVRASAKEAVRVSFTIEIDTPAPQRMNNTPEGQELKLRRALERLESIQPSDVPVLAHSGLEWLNDHGLHATRASLDTAGRRIIKPTKDEGPVKTPPYFDAYPVRLDNTEQVVWLRPDPSRFRRGYRPIGVVGQRRETNATLAALTVLESSISDPEELHKTLLKVADLGPEILEKAWTFDEYESIFPVLRELEDAENPERGAAETPAEEKWVRLLHKYVRGLDNYRKLHSLRYLVALLKYYRPGFDKYSWEDQLALMERACAYFQGLVEAVRKLTAFLEYGTPSGLPNRAVETLDRDIQAAILKDVDDLTYREIGQELGIPPPRNVDIKGDYSTARMAVNRGRKILERALEEKGGWSKEAEKMKAEATRWKSLSGKEKLRKTLAEHLDIASRNPDAFVWSIAEAFAGEPGFSEEEIRRDLF